MPADLKAAFKRFQSDQITDYAAGLTYYSLLSLFPALLFAVALLGVFGQQGLINETADYLKTAGAPDDTVNAVTSALDSAQSQKGHRDHRAGARPRAVAERRLGRVRRGRAGAQPRLARRGGSRLRQEEGATISSGRSSSSRS